MYKIYRKRLLNFNKKRNSSIKIRISIMSYKMKMTEKMKMMAHITRTEEL